MREVNLQTDTKRLEPCEDAISRQAAIDAVADGLKRVFVENRDVAEILLKSVPSAQPYTTEEIQKMADLEQAEIEKAFELGREDAMSKIILCKDCKHRPTRDEDGELDFPTSRCPCQCDDFYYSWMPNAEWFCGNAERREK